MAQIKSYVDLENYDEITAFAGADAGRVVRSYVVTEEGGQTATRVITDLAAQRGAAPSIHFLSGKRGSGKSHLLAFLRSLVSVRSLRSVLQNPQLQNALYQLTNKTQVTVELSFPAGEQPAFESVLRGALDAVLVEGAAFDDERWGQAVEREQVFEQTLSVLPLGAQLILFIDNLSGRWSSAPAVVEDDLKWLKVILRQSHSLPLRAVIALSDEDCRARLADHELTGDQQSILIHEVSPQVLREAVAQGVLRKKPAAGEKLSGLYHQVRKSLPNFAWSEREFIDYYPVHPALATLAPVVAGHSRSFSLPGFAATAVSRALNRPELSLVATDEVFDRYEYELRKDESTEEAFALYDRIITEALNLLSGEDRLWAKMLAKALTLFLLAETPVEVCTLADATLLFEGSEGTESGYERAARILEHFEKLASKRIFIAGKGVERTWHLLASPASAPVPLREQLAAAAGEIGGRDPRLGGWLITAGGSVFADWNPDCGDAEGGPAESAFREVAWRGTVRRGRICLDVAEAMEKAPVTESADDPLDLDISAPTTSSQEDTATETGEEWRLLIAPFNCGLTPESPARTLTGLRWHPGTITDEAALEPLRMLVALHERTSGAASPNDDPEEVSLIRAELHEQVRALFTGLYLERGTFVDHTGARPLSAGGRKASELAELLGQEICATLDSYYPDHPHFAEHFTGDHVSALLTGLFASSSPGHEQTRELATKFATPLGLVSESRGRHRLNVFNEAANLPPFIHALVTTVEMHADAEGRADVPLRKVMRLLGVAPFGLQPAAQHLILVAFISSGVYELVDEASGRRLTKSNLYLGFEPARFTTLRRVATTDYPLDILHTWSKCLTGRQDLPALVSPDARQKVRDTLAEWLEDWRDESLQERFEGVPADFMTMMTWHTVSLSIRRYERVAVIVESILEDALTIETGLSRILDLFGLDIAALEQTRLKMQSLAGFLVWLPTFINIRNYLLAAETTGEQKIDGECRALTARLRQPHELLMPEARVELEQAFEVFREAYSNYYAMAHETSVGPQANQEMLESFFASSEWQNFKLLIQLKLDGRAFESDARMLAELVEKTRCELPIADILQRQPHCSCSFRLNRRLNLGSVLDGFRGLTRSAATYYCEELWKRREILRLGLLGRENDPLVAAVSHFLAECGNGRTDSLTQEVAGFINEHLPEEPVIAVLPELPRFEGGSFTREQLREHINRWLESLPEGEGVRFRVERA